jgi:hypothetical protein
LSNCILVNLFVFNRWISNNLRFFFFILIFILFYILQRLSIYFIIFHTEFPLWIILLILISTCPRNIIFWIIRCMILISCILRINLLRYFIWINSLTIVSSLFNRTYWLYIMIIVNSALTIELTIVKFTMTWLYMIQVYHVLCSKRIRTICCITSYIGNIYMFSFIIILFILINRTYHWKLYILSILSLYDHLILLLIV